MIFSELATEVHRETKNITTEIYEAKDESRKHVATTFTGYISRKLSKRSKFYRYNENILQKKI